MIPAPEGDAATLRDLRRARRTRRLGDTEWFDVLYRVYLFALGGLIFVVWASDSLDDVLDDQLATPDLVGRGPALAGTAITLAVAVGLRNGADGGPVSVEPADVRHLLSSPVDRRRALLRPVVQRLRAVCFVPAVVLAVVGQLVARDAEGSRAAWAAAGAIFGVTLGLAYVTAALGAHAVRAPGWLATSAGALVVAAQAAAAVDAWRAVDAGAREPIGGPFDPVGGIALWGIRTRPAEVVALVVLVVLALAAIVAAGRLRLEALERRGALVSQLRFAATVQDLRTVVLLRRQLRSETARSRAWIPIARAPATLRGGGHGAPGRPPTRPHAALRAGGVERTAAWRRSVVSIARLGVPRLLRMIALAAAAGIVASLLVTGSLLLSLPLVALVFLVGLESVEPLAQEIDHPDLTDGLPVDRGLLHLHLLVGPAALLAALGLCGAVAAVVVEPDHAAGAVALAIPVSWSGAIGAVVSTVRDAAATETVASTTLTGRDRGHDSPFALPEFAGASNVMTALLPIVCSAVGVAPVVAMRASPAPSTVGRAVVGVALCLLVTAWWIRRRDRWAVRVREFFAAGRAAA